MKLDDYRAGNHVRYEGSHSGFSGRNGVITSISPVDGKNTYDVLISRDPSQPAETVVAYSGELRPILIDESFLEKQGFGFNPQTKHFRKGNVVICRVGFVKNTSDRWNLGFDDRGYRAITAPITDYSDETEVMKKTLGVHSVNAFQNYYHDVHKTDPAIVL